MGSLSEKSVLAVMSDCKPNIRNPQQKIALAVHASFIASGFTLHQSASSADGGKTWRPAPDWNHHQNNNYGFEYLTPGKSTNKIGVRVIEKGESGIMMVTAERLDCDSCSRSNANIKWSHYVAEDEHENDPDFGGLVERIEKKLVKRFDDRPRDPEGKILKVSTQMRAKLYLGPKSSTHGDASERKDTDEEGRPVRLKDFPPNMTLKKFAEELKEYRPEGFRLVIDKTDSPYVKFESEALKSESFVSSKITLERFAKKVIHYGHDEGYQLIVDNTGNFCAKLDFECASYRREVAKAKEGIKGPTGPRHGKVARRLTNPSVGPPSKKRKRSHGDGAERNDTDEEGRSVCVRNLPA